MKDTRLKTLMSIHQNAIPTHYHESDGGVWFYTLNGKQRAMRFQRDNTYLAYDDQPVESGHHHLSLIGTLPSLIGERILPPLRTGMAFLPPHPGFCPTNASYNRFVFAVIDRIIGGMVVEGHFRKVILMDGHKGIPDVKKQPGSFTTRVLTDTYGPYMDIVRRNTVTWPSEQYSLWDQHPLEGD